MFQLGNWKDRRRRRVASVLLALAATFHSLPVMAEEGGVELVTEKGAVTTEHQQTMSLSSPFPLHLGIALNGGYDTNVSTSGNNGQSSAYTSGDIDLSMRMETDRAHLAFDIATQLLYYLDSVADPNPEVNFHGSFEAMRSFSRFLQMSTNLYAAYQAEPDFSANVGPTRRAGYFFTTTDTFSSTFNWLPGFSTVLTDNIRVVRYDNEAVAFYEDRWENTVTTEVRYGIGRGSLVGEYRFEVIDYEDFPRDSTSHNVLGGIDYRFNDQFNMTARGGFTWREYEGGSERTEPVAEASATYQAGPKSSINWTASYGLEEPDSPLYLSRTTFRTGFQVHYWLTAHLLATLAAYYSHDDNEVVVTAVPHGSPPTTDDAGEISVGLQYALNSRWGTHIGIDYSGDTSNGSAQRYSRIRYTAGININF